ncbi:hypothetical protein QFZ22_000664 [Streptomyces canus]|uniref:LysM domain-containing protein n=1 Tax=Streptomyces canus TaxID=58343 RepID=A0AAW8F4F4_9ACTN|nr:LysM peptidoglycan-binding domain-containing protein [Streptomyces canus]MDQ0904679.1 hypothetical protein [Streptomyces canus]
MVVEEGDTLWSIAEQHLGSGTQWQTIYSAAKAAIEKAAKEHQRPSSEYGHWIFPGTALRFPGLNTPVVHRLNESSEKVKAYWTKQRMQAAKPAHQPEQTEHEQPANPAPSEVLRNPLQIPGTAAPHLPKTSAPEHPAGAAAEVWSSHEAMPASTVGKLYFVLNLPDGQALPGSCTATVVAAENRSTLWTAGHCVNTGGPVAGPVELPEGLPAGTPQPPAGTWYSTFMFAPDHSPSGDPHGTWTANQVITPGGWADVGLRAFDVAALVLDPNGDERVADTTGSQGIRFSGQLASFTDVYAFGYPTSLLSGEALENPEELRYCTGSTRNVFFVLNGLDCNMGQGASGGPWISDLQFSRGWGYIVGNSSAQVLTGSFTSPYLGLEALLVYNAARNA